MANDGTCLKSARGRSSGRRRQLKRTLSRRKPVWRAASAQFNFLSLEGSAINAAIGAILLSLFCAHISWRQRMGRGSVVATTFHEKGVQPLRSWLEIESSRASHRRVERPSTAGIPTGSGQGRPDAASPSLDRHLHRPAAGGNLKVGPFYLHRDGAASGVHFLAPGPHIVSHRDHAGLDLNGIRQVLRRKSSPIPKTFALCQVERAGRPGLARCCSTNCPPCRRVVLWIRKALLADLLADLRRRSRSQMQPARRQAIAIAREVDDLALSDSAGFWPAETGRRERGPAKVAPAPSFLARH